MSKSAILFINESFAGDLNSIGFDKRSEILTEMIETPVDRAADVWCNKCSYRSELCICNRKD